MTQVAGEAQTPRAASGRLEKALAGLRHLPRTLRLVWQAAPGWTAAWAAMVSVQGLLPAATALVTRQLINALVTANRGPGAGSFQAVALLAGLAAALLLVGELLQTLTEWVRTGQAEHVQDRISTLIQEKATAVDLAFYESPEYHDRLHQALIDASSRPLALLESCGSVLQNGVTLLAMMVVLLPYGIGLPLVLIASALPALFVVFRTNRAYHAWWQKRTPERRRTQYLGILLTDGKAAAEVRLCRLGEPFRAAFQAIRATLRAERLRISRSQSLARLGGGLASLAATAGALLWMLWRVTSGAMTLGDLALFYQAFNAGQGMMRTLLSNLGQIYSHSLFLENLYAFLDLRPAIVDPPDPVAPPAQLVGGVRFRDLTFRYPGSRRPVLERFNLEIPAGKIVAVVGPNGAGKSTLLKLLSRLYDPEEGGVELDGVDLRRFTLEGLSRCVTALFQFPLFYYGSAEENIALGDWAARPGREKVEAAARAAGIHEKLAALPSGYDTQLGRWFNEGCELSGGEWQRVAMARAFVSRAPIILLDEPTSMMDSWAEAEWFQQLKEIASGRTVLLITHRFSIAMRADIIHVMEHGRVIESGSHEELVAQGGLYAGSWREQMRAAAAGTDLDEPLPEPAAPPELAGELR